MRTQVRISTSGSLQLTKFLPDAGNGRLEVAADVVRQRLKRRDIQDLSLVFEAAIDTLPNQVVDGRHERGQRFARAGGRRNQHITASLDERPRLCLGRSGHLEVLFEPRGNGVMK